MFGGGAPPDRKIRYLSTGRILPLVSKKLLVFKLELREKELAKMAVQKSRLLQNAWSGRGQRWCGEELTICPIQPS
jgi:hypothetical protein